MTVAAYESAPRSVVLTLATALERLGARITRDLDTEANDGAPPEDARWAAAIEGVVRYAEECLRVLDDPFVVDVMSGDET
jgi:hypothetical protein